MNTHPPTSMLRVYTPSPIEVAETWRRVRHIYEDWSTDYWGDPIQDRRELLRRASALMDELPLDFEEAMHFVEVSDSDFAIRLAIRAAVMANRGLDAAYNLLKGMKEA